MNTAVIRQDWAGRIIDGRFTLLEWLGGTGASGVFLTQLAGDPPRKAALKLIPADVGDAEAFMAAWSAAAVLSHPHLMRLFHTGRCRIDNVELLYVVTEYAEENLSEIIPTRPLTTAETREMLDPVLDALSCLHGKGFVHGRLKPSNIMVVGNELKLSTDRLYLSGRLWKHLPAPGVYDAPETATRMSAAADVWSLGVTLVETLTQQRPSWDKSTGADPLVPETVPQPYAGIARACLRRDPTLRCSVDEVKDRLELARTLPAIADKADKWKPTSFPIAAVVAGVVALLALIAVLVLRSHRTSPATPAPSSMPAEPQASATPQPSGEPQASAGPQTSGSTVKGAVAARVMPEVSPGASATIRGTVKVATRVAVDSNGHVSDASFQAPGPSRYFARQALEASQRWSFRPPQVDGRAVASTWVLHFEFRQSGVEVTPVETAP